MQDSNPKELWQVHDTELLSSCCKSCFQLLLFQALIHTTSTGPAIPSCKNKQDMANNGWKSSRVAQCLSHRCFQDATVKCVPSQLSIGATGTHLPVPKLLLLPQRAPKILVLIMNSASHASAPAAPTKNTYWGREIITCALQAQGIHRAPRAEKKLLNIYSLFSNEST